MILLINMFVFTFIAQNRIKVLIGIIILMLFAIRADYSFGQAPTVQDCGGAIAICQNQYYEANSYSGDGNIGPEINAYPYGPSCTSEDNSVWYVFTSQTTGNFSFIITPNNTSGTGDDYDWAVYDLTNANCSDIYSNPSLEISCNSYGTLYGFNGQTGASTAMGGWGNSHGPGDLNGPPWNADIPVVQGGTYVLMVSNWTGSPYGYSIDFGYSTAQIFDNVSPHIESITSNISCGASQITFNFSENIECTSLNSCDITLTGPGGPYTISNIAGAGCSAGADQENTFTITFSPPVTVGGNFSINLDSAACGSVTDLCGNVASSGSLPFIINLPVPDAGAAQTVCAGTVVTLSATGGTSFSWNNGVINGVPFVPPTTLTYTVTVSDAGGCTASDTVTVTVNPVPAAYAGPDQTVCSGQSVTLSASGGGTYNWNNGVIDGVPFIPVASAVYSVTVYSNNCSATDDVTVTVNASIVADAGYDQVVCAGDTVTLTASGGTTYTWNNGVSDGAPFTPVTTAIYTVTAATGNCSATDNVLVIVNPLPNAEAGNNQYVCSGADVTLSGSGGVSYLWSGGISDNVPFTTSTASVTTYTLTVTDSNNCSATDFVVLVVNNIPVVDLGKDTLLCEGESIILDAENPGANYLWSSGEQSQYISVSDAGRCWVTVANGACIASDTVIIRNPPEISLGPDVSLCNELEVILSPRNPYLSYSWSTGDTSQWIKADTAGLFWVTALYQHCRLSDTVEITGGINAVYLPSAFTPDFDLENDIFKGYGEGITMYYLKIFNRWGEPAFQTSDIATPWDGKINGVNAPVGVYVWMLDYKTECTGERLIRKYGRVTLLR